MEKLWTDIYVDYVLTGETWASVTPEKLIPRNKINIKPLAMSPPGKDPIPNQDKNTLELQKYQCLSPHVPTFILDLNH